MSSPNEHLPSATLIVLSAAGLAAALGIAAGLVRPAAAPGAASHADPGKPAIAAAPVEFSTAVRPILAKNCFLCHGPDEATRKGGLRLDDRAAATRPLASGETAIVPGSPARSAVIARLREPHADRRMPAPGSGRRLDPKDIETLERWIAEGAEYRPHWSLRPLQTPPVPFVRAADWPRTDLDRFTLAAIEDSGLSPAPDAPRATWLRRVTFALTGLGPSPEELDRFLADDGPEAESAAVDRLLESPHFGEKWAAFWLDLARYADTQGYEKDPTRSIWPYRDWVIRAFNADLPFDIFSRDQLAGDLLPDATDDTRIATAFHRNTMTNDEGGTDDEEFRVAAVIDRTNTTAQIWLGLTMNCAQCHSHKYDPITQTDYYRFFAYFDQSEDSDKVDERPTLAYQPPGGPAVQVPVMRELTGNARRTTHRFKRGSFLTPAEAVQPGVPEVFGVPEAEMPKNRLELANWLFSGKTPLPARVTVNRIWERLFGTGIVETLEDFGVQGTMPSNALLLDHLAAGFRDDGWSVKRLLRRIVLSRTFRQSSVIDERSAAADPANRLLARGPRFRLDAEEIRDQALFAAGILSEKMFGPPVFPYQPPGLWQIIYSGEDWKESPGDDRHRRAVYTFWRRTMPYPLMTNFDAPTRDVCVSRRLRTNTPLQALQTMNDPAFAECAKAAAERALAPGGDDLRIAERLFRFVLARLPEADERAKIAAFVAHETAARSKTGGDEHAVRVSAWAAAARVLLNLDEALTKE